MRAEGRLLRVALLASVLLHVAVIGALARRGPASAIDLDELRVVAVGTYTPPALRAEIGLPRELERRRPAPPRPRRFSASAFAPPPRPAPRVPPLPRPRIAAAPRQPVPLPPPPPVPPPRVIAAPQPPVPRPQPVPSAPQPAAARPLPPPALAAPSPHPRLAARTPPVRIAQARPLPSLAPPAAAPGNSGGRLNPGSTSAAGSVPGGGGGSTPAGHVSNEGTGGSGSGSGDVPRGRGSAEPAPNPVRAERPGPQGAAPVRAPLAPPSPTVAVRICRRSGLRAGKYCAEYGGPVVEKAFVSGQEPDERCTVCKPPPEPEREHVNRSADSRDAVLVREVRPEKPEELEEAGAHGSVTVTYTVDERGRVTDVKVSHSSGYPSMDRCAVEAVKRFRYKPAEQAGEARAVRLSREFPF